MKANRYILHTEGPTGARQRVWNSRHQATIGHPKRFTLKQETRSAFRLRDAVSMQEYELTWKQLQEGVRLDAIEKTGPKVRLRLSPLTTPPAAFRSSADRIDPSAQLYVYRSVAQWMLEADPVSDAFVGFKRGTPMFSLSREADRFRIRALGSALRLRTRGDEPRVLRPGDECVVKRDELSETILVSGAHNWRFGFISGNGRDFLALPDAGVDPDTTWNRAFGTLAFALLFGFMSAMWWEQGLFRRNPETKPEKTYTVVAEDARFVLQRSGKQANKPKAAQTAPAPAQSQAQPQAQPQSGEAKKAAQQERKPPHPAKPAAPAKPSTQAKAAPPAQLPKAETVARPVVVAPPPPSVAETMKAMISGSVKTGTDLKQKAEAARASGSSSDWFDSKQPSKEIGVGGASDSQLIDTNVRSVGSLALGTEGYSAQGPAQGNSETVGGALKGDWVQAGGDQLQVEEGLSKDEVGDVIRANLREVRYCYEQASRRYPKIQGKLVLGFTIGTRGEIKTAKVNSSSVTETGIDSCVLERLWAWKFPVPKGGKPVSVEFPFVFRTLGNREIKW